MPETPNSPGQTEKQEKQDKLSQWVRTSLAHLYDAAFLQTHPLGSLLEGAQPADDITRAQKLRRLLLDAIESLRPQDARLQATEAARAYAILTYRYVDGLSMEEVAEKLALSRRQIYREHEKGIEAIASLLADRQPRNAELAANAITAEGEVDRLRRTSNADALSADGLLRSVIGLLEPLSLAAGRPIQLHTGGALPQVKADRVHLRQALINVLTQAIDRAQADISVVASAAANTISIEIDAAEADALPCEDSANEQPCMELDIARALVSAQGGELEMRTGPGFHARISLPAIEDKASILVIDDNTDMVEMFRRFLGGHKVSVVGVSDSDRALKLCAEMQPQLVTLDVMMPHLDGWDVLERLKAQPATRNIPVIVCSVLNEAKLALAMGASGYLTKPVNQSEFLAMAQRWLGPLAIAR